MQQVVAEAAPLEPGEQSTASYRVDGYWNSGPCGIYLEGVSEVLVEAVAQLAVSGRQQLRLSGGGEYRQTHLYENHRRGSWK